MWDEYYLKGIPFFPIDYEYGRQLLRGQRPEWHCRAGARFLYVDEFGKVQLCSAQRGRLDKPVIEYGVEDLRLHRKTRKGCEAGCSLLCVYRDSQLDNLQFGLLRNAYRTLRAALRRSTAGGARARSWRPERATGVAP
jgi:hypothetical protein